MPLPLREFYSTKRAAELLGCELDDFAHWAMNGCIRLYMKIDSGYGVVLEEEIDDLIYYDDFDEIFKDSDLKVSLDEIERLHTEFIDRDEEDGIEEEYQSYYDKKRSLVLKALIEYNSSQGDDLALNKISLRSFFSYLLYLEKKIVSERFCLVHSVKTLNVNGRHDNYLKNLIDSGNEALIKDLVVISGFFALDSTFFSDYDLYSRLDVDNCGMSSNLLLMPESELSISLLIDEIIDFNISDLYIFKADFQKILKASEDGSAMNSDYPQYMPSNLHLWMKRGNYISGKDKQGRDKDIGNPPKERLSLPARSALRMLIEKHYPEHKNKPSKLAEILTAEARQTQEFQNLKFDGETVARWVGLRNGRTESNG